MECGYVVWNLVYQSSRAVDTSQREHGRYFRRLWFRKMNEEKQKTMKSSCFSSYTACLSDT
jgi:hypothetical protein